MGAELVRELLQATLAASAAIVLVLALRRSLRARLGARSAYRAWLLVPVAMVAVWLPAASGSAASADATVGTFSLIARNAAAGALPAQLPVQATALLLAAWAAGSAGLLLWFALRQHRFTRLLTRTKGRVFDVVDGQGPALVGWWRSRIVLPADFRERYDRGERRLVVAHEISHLRHGDIHAQALATGLRCLFWFNPLVHFAASMFRFDQELACDASVLERFPRARARYGSAMLKTQLAGFGLPVGCHWQSSHPLKERIEMLKQPLPARTRKIAGSLFVATMVGCGTWAAWAAQPAATQASATRVAAAKAKPAAAQASYLQYVSDEDVLTAPTYPKGLDVHGKVEIELLVGADGSVKDVSVLKSEPAGVFDAMTVAAARKWHITPARAANGVPFERRVRTTVEYRPDGAPKGEG